MGEQRPTGSLEPSDCRPLHNKSPSWEDSITASLTINNGRGHGVHQAEGRWPGQQRDPLQSEADHSDGQTEEVIRREGWRPYHISQVFVRWKKDNDDETPKALEMEQDDVIEVYQEQTGGL